MHLNAQTALIVSGKSQEQKQRVKVYGRLLQKEHFELGAARRIHPSPEDSDW